MYYYRHIEPVIARIAKRKAVVVLTGARQVGKSTMLKTEYRKIRYVDLSSPLVRQSAEQNPSLFFRQNKPPLIVDEIQKAGTLFDYIKADADASGKKGQFFLTGSQSLGLMKNVSESLAGRAGIVKMLGLSLRELSGGDFREPFVPKRPDKAQKRKAAALSWDEAALRVHKGSFPELWETKSDLRDWSDFYGSYLQTYIEKDIRDVLQIQDESAFLKFVKACAALTGQMLNMTNLAELCGKDIKTAQKWLSVLESSGLVYILEPYYNNINKRLLKTPKLYFLDSGLACFLLGWNTPEQLTSGAMWGHIFESFVFAEILKSYYNEGIVRPPLYYYRDKEKNEIDLLIQDGGTMHPVEIKATSDPVKSMTAAFSCLEKISSFKRAQGAVVCLADKVLPLSEEVTILPMWMI